MRSVVLIGASGYLGSKVLEALKKRSVKVYAIQNSSPVNKCEGVEVIEGGLNSLTIGNLNRLNPEIIFHCGRPTYSRLRKLGRQLAARKAGRLNSKLIRNIKKSEINTKLVFASGSLVYGNSEEPHNEDSAPNPISYSKQYFNGELPILNETGNDDFKVLTLRFPWLIGNGSWFGWFYLKNIEQTGRIPLFGDGINHLSILNINDAAELMVEYGVSNVETGVYNIFSPDTPTQFEFAEMVSKTFGCKIVPYSELYPKLERAALDAFTSNILLNTNSPEILDGFHFLGVEEGLGVMKSEGLRG